jgi:hypothetical protein
MMAGISALTSWGVGRLNALIAALPPLPQNPGEAAIAFQLRQVQYAAEQSVTLTLRVLHQTFTLAALLCLVALLPAFLLTRRDDRGGADPDLPRVRGFR